jgi:hypothetical protein
MSDGTAAGTQIVKDINPLFFNGSIPLGSSPNTHHGIVALFKFFSCHTLLPTGSASLQGGRLLAETGRLVMPVMPLLETPIVLEKKLIVRLRHVGPTFHDRRSVTWPPAILGSLIRWWS